MTGNSPGNKRVSRLFPAITDGAKRRLMLGTNRPNGSLNPGRWRASIKPASVLRPANSEINCRFLPGSHRGSRHHLLDPTFVKRLTGFPDRTVTSLLLVPALIGIAGLLINGWHSDKSAERRWHAAIPLLVAGLMFGLLIAARHDIPLALLFVLLGSGSLYAYYPLSGQYQP